MSKNMFKEVKIERLMIGILYFRQKHFKVLKLELEKSESDMNVLI